MIAIVSMRVRDFWRANGQASYRTATEQGSVVSFVAPIVTTILAVVGVSALTENQLLAAIGGVPLGSVLWFGYLMLFVTPGRMWVANQERLEPRIKVIAHPNDYICLRGLDGTEMYGLTVMNVGASALTGVRVIFDTIDPLPTELSGPMGFDIPPIGASIEDDWSVDLQPETPQHFELFWVDRRTGRVATWHSTNRWWSPNRFPATVTLRIAANESKPLLLLLRVEPTGDESDEGRRLRIYSANG
jgi:hypothetical protein